MKPTLWLPGVVACALVVASPAAADQAKANPAADIADVYAWVDGGNLVLVMNVMPGATATSTFSDQVQYAFHLESAPAVGQDGKPATVVCTFDAQQRASCWVGASDYVTGDASSPDGLSSASGKLRVFAGPRANPMFFNLGGFKEAAAALSGAMPSLMFDAAGCPALDAATASVLVSMLQGTATGSQPGQNAFQGTNVLSLVVTVDKSLVTPGGPIVTVWGSTHQAGG